MATMPGKTPIDSNPNSPINPGISATIATPTASTKPGYPTMENAKPLPHGQDEVIQQNAQSNLPYTPNNGNPNGAHNNGRRPNQFTTRFGGGYIGNRPEGSVAGVNGYGFGRGALTQGQMDHNAAVQAAPPAPLGTGNVLQQLMAHFARRSGPPQPGGLPVSDFANGPTNMQQQFNQFAAQDPQTANYGYPTLNSQGYNTNTYYGGQNPSLGRYQPPQMVNGQWTNQGGYNYNLPNAYGPYPNYQTGPYGYGNDYR